MIKINGNNLQTSCGFFPDSGRETSNSIERPNDPAQVFSHKWDDGVVEYDLVTLPGKEPRLFKITGVLYATSEADYDFKKSALETIIRVQKATIYHEEIDKTVNAKFKGFTRWERLTGIKNAAQIVVRIAMEFDELLGIAFPSYNMFSGASNAVPFTVAAIQALTASVKANEITVNTGTTGRVISVVLQSNLTILNGTDLDNPFFPAVSYPMKGNVTVAGVNLKVFSLELGSPYSTNHRHKFIIS